MKLFDGKQKWSVRKFLRFGTFKEQMLVFDHTVPFDVKITFGNSDFRLKVKENLLLTGYDLLLPLYLLE